MSSKLPENHRREHPPKHSLASGLHESHSLARRACKSHSLARRACIGNGVTLVAAVCGLAALALAVWTNVSLNARVDAGIQRRENQIVATYSSKLLQICEDFGIEPAVEPRTVDDLITITGQIVLATQD